MKPADLQLSCDRSRGQTAPSHCGTLHRPAPPCALLQQAAGAEVQSPLRPQVTWPQIPPGGAHRFMATAR